MVGHVLELLLGAIHPQALMRTGLANGCREVLSSR
jgi:hypothetical protein